MPHRLCLLGVRRRARLRLKDPAYRSGSGPRAGFKEEYFENLSHSKRETSGFRSRNRPDRCGG